LDETHASLSNDHRDLEVMGQLCRSLNDIRERVSKEEWKFVQSRCLSHPLRELLHQDPFTSRAFDKPRGYAGDAVMMDYIYSGVAPPGTSDMGAKVFSATTRLPGPLSVIQRRNYIAQLIDDIARQNTHPRILSVACGHLIEAGCSQAVQSGAVEAFYALDQDPQSLAKVEADKPEGARIITVNASVKSIMEGRISYANLNLIYALGLYDYLSEEAAKKLTESLFEMLAPNGKLVLLNFTPDNHGRGYMEAFMDWFLIYRDEYQLRSCSSAIDRHRIADIRAFRDCHRNIAYLEIVKS
jgi:hypothetical protein